MGDVLPKENVCEKENRERLPSPQELQGKIILKGSFKLQRAGVSVHVGFTQSVLVFFSLLQATPRRAVSIQVSCFESVFMYFCSPQPRQDTQLQSLSIAPDEV